MCVCVGGLQMPCRRHPSSHPPTQPPHPTHPPLLPLPPMMTHTPSAARHVPLGTTPVMVAPEGGRSTPRMAISGTHLQGGVGVHEVSGRVGVGGWVEGGAQLQAAPLARLHSCGAAFAHSSPFKHVEHALADCCIHHLSHTASSRGSSSRRGRGSVSVGWWQGGVHAGGEARVGGTHHCGAPAPAPPLPACGAAAP